jgi:hypothetical protein
MAHHAVSDDQDDGSCRIDRKRGALSASRVWTDANTVHGRQLSKSEATCSIASLSRMRLFAHDETPTASNRTLLRRPNAQIRRQNDATSLVSTSPEEIAKTPRRQDFEGETAC